MGSSVLEHAIKVRKPYTITKQRERWTEEEHNKFVEALKLYGRAWHRIEEHIGSKTAVQIRSHAQKFFTKAVRESKTIEIPPPRPKKKPMHPYPRKLGNSPGVPVTEKFPVPEHDNPSPTSVLSSASDQMNGCTSPVSSAVGSDPVGTSPCEQENGCHSTTTSVDDEDESLLQHTSDMELDLGLDDGVRGKEASSMQASPASLKLFGKTVVVSNPQNPSSSNIGDPEPAITVDIARQFPARGDEESAIDGVSWSCWPNNMAPMFYILPSRGNLGNFSEAGVAAMPWIWAFSGGNQSLVRECSDEGSVEKESSSADSNNVELSVKDASTHVVFSDGALNDHGEMPVKFTRSETSAFRSLKATPKKDAKGFVPYKRCIATREVDDRKMINDDGEELRVLQLSL